MFIENEIDMNTEVLRDFCGSFYDLARIDHKDEVVNRNYKLLHNIPGATLKAMKEEYKGDEAIMNYKALLQQGFETLIYNEDIKLTMVKVLLGMMKPEEVQSEMIVKILDTYYIDAVPTRVEIVALEM